MTAPTQYRVFLIGADSLAWDGLRTIVGRIDDVLVTGEAFDPRGAVEAAVAANPDAVLLGSPLQGRPSSGLVRNLHERCPTAKVVVLADELEADELPAYAAAGVSGYLLLNALTAAAVRLCLRAVLEAHLVVTVAAAAEAMAAAWQMGFPRLHQPIGLSERERAVLRGLAAGLTREEIAATEHLSLRTVERIVAVLAVQFEAPSAFVLGMKVASLRLVS